MAQVQAQRGFPFLFPFPLALAAAVLVGGGVDAFVPYSPASYNINGKLSQHRVPAAASSAAAGDKLAPVIGVRSARPPTAGPSMLILLKPSPGVSDLRCSASSMTSRRVSCGAERLLSLDDRDDGDQGAGRGRGGGDDNGNGKGGGGGGDEFSAGDEEASDDERDPLVLAGVVGSGLGGALHWLKEAMGNLYLRMPWARKVTRRTPVDSDPWWTVIWRCADRHAGN